MTDILHQIVEHKRGEVAQAANERTIESLMAQAADQPATRDFFGAVTDQTLPMRVIAEVKKASPSAGVIRPDFDPVSIAQAYQCGGAAAISCLTDRHYFQGDLSYIQQIKSVVDLPVLRKEFVIAPYQLYETRAAGADAVLLIAECLANDELADLIDLAVDLQLTVLVEIHGQANLAPVQALLDARAAQPILLGINNRDLRAMKTDLSHTINLIDQVNRPERLVSESGIRTHEDIARLIAAGVGITLVGEHLMKQPDVQVALQTLLGR